MKHLDNNLVNVVIDGQSVEKDESEKLLGIFIQDNLKWSTQVIEMIKKLKKRLGSLIMIINIAPLKIRKMIYEGIFNSVLTYCMPVWGGLSKSEMDDLQVMQNKALIATLKKPPRENRNIMYENSGYLTVRQLIFYHTTLSVYKIRMTKEPEYLYERLRKHLRFPPN